LQTFCSSRVSNKQTQKPGSAGPLRLAAIAFG
jgi:hypothetical protein